MKEKALEEKEKEQKEREEKLKRKENELNNEKEKNIQEQEKLKQEFEMNKQNSEKSRQENEKIEQNKEIPECSCKNEAIHNSHREICEKIIDLIKDYNEFHILLHPIQFVNMLFISKNTKSNYN